MTFDVRLQEIGLELKEQYTPQEVRLLLGDKNPERLVLGGFLDGFDYYSLRAFYEVTEGYLLSREWVRANEAIKALGLSNQGFYLKVRSKGIRALLSPVTYKKVYSTVDILAVINESELVYA